MQPPEPGIPLGEIQHHAPMTKAKLQAAVREFLENWNRTLLVIGYVGSVVLFLLSNLFPSVQASREILQVFLWFTGGALVFVLLEIQSILRAGAGFSTEPNFSAARQKMIRAVIDGTRQRTLLPLTVRCVGMRLNAIHQFLADLAHDLRSEKVGMRPIKITVFHVNPEFLAAHQSMAENANGRSSLNRHDGQIAAMKGSIAEIQSMYSKVQNVTVEIRNYQSIPLFWAVEIDKKSLFWGFFLWDDDQDTWIGPENECIIMQHPNAAEKLVLDGLQNRIEALERWSVETK
jgi:hypothetical protein